jgi:hypothetical protein
MVTDSDVDGPGVEVSSLLFGTLTILGGTVTEGAEAMTVVVNATSGGWTVITAAVTEVSGVGAEGADISLVSTTSGLGCIVLVSEVVCDSAAAGVAGV